jgi:DNA-binding NarL/FixJ family response regulator
MPSVRVAIADDHPVVRSGIHDLLAAADDITVVGEAGCGEEALELVEEEQPDVLLLDMEMPGLTGPEVAERLQKRNSPVRLLALSSYDDQEYVQGLLDSGASGYLTKENAPDLILEAVRAVADGEVRWFVQPDRRTTSNPDLTERETEILRLIARGYSNDEVAEALHIAGSTVRKHATSIYRKLGADSAREAIAWAWQHGVMSEEPGSTAEGT